MASVQAGDWDLVPSGSPTTTISVQPAGSGPRGGHARLDLSNSLTFRSTGRLRGTVGERVGGWRFGFIQLKHITTEWAEYRGATRTDGSILAAMDRPPARPSQLCRDHAERGSGVFYNPEEAVTDPTSTWSDTTLRLAPTVTIPASGQLELEVSMGDTPWRRYPLVERNTETSSPTDNFLRALESRAAYIVVLTAQDPQGRYHFLKHCYWNVHWQAEFRRSPGGLFSIANRAGAVNVQRQVHSGEPSDPRFRGRLTSTLPVCARMLEEAFRHPKRLNSSATWRQWRVARP